MTINRKFFFDHVRSTVFTGKLTATQVAGMTTILDEWDTNHAQKDDRWLAYALGTAFHETAFTMQPINEFGGNTYFFNRYDMQSPNASGRSTARVLGNNQRGDGVLFHGRGFVQLTGRTNYTKMGTRFTADLTGNAAAADGALKPPLAAKIMFQGMEAGAFTGKGFARYFSPAVEDWFNARRIINGTDQAGPIADYGKRFYAALSHTV
jgi:putative chitinase